MRALPPRRIALGALCAALLTATTGPAALAADSAPERDRAVSSAALLAQVRDTDAHRSDLSPVVDLVRAVLESDDGRLPADRARMLGDAARAAVAGAADDDPSASVTVTTVTTPTSTSSATPATTPATTPAVAQPATGVLLPAAGTTGLADDALGAVREALDGVLELLLPKDDASTTDQEPTTATDQESSTATQQQSSTITTDQESVTITTDQQSSTATYQDSTVADDLLSRMDELIEALIGADPETSAEVSTLPAPAEAAPAAPAASAPAGPAVLPALTSLLLPGS